MDGGSVHDLIMKNKKTRTKEILRMHCDRYMLLREGLKFLNDHRVIAANPFLSLVY